MTRHSFNIPKTDDKKIALKLVLKEPGETSEMQDDSVRFTERGEFNGSVIYLIEHGECYTELASEQEIMKGDCGPELIGLFKEYLSAKRNKTSLSESVENTSPGDPKSRTKSTHTSKSVESITAAAL